MAATIRPATAADLPAVADYLAGALRGEGGAARYRRYLAPSWQAARPEIGVVIESDHAIGGFLGAIWSERRIEGRAQLFCNVHSCAVDEAHRKLTLRAFNALLADKDATYTCFSPSEQIAKILDFFKFAHRPGERVVVPAVGLPRLFGARVYRSPEAIEAALDDEGRRLARDHARYRCAQLVIERGGRRCHVIAVRRGRGVRTFAEILHASDPAMLGDELGTIRLPLLVSLRTPLVGIDRRWLPSAPLVSGLYGKLRPTYARSPTLPIDRIDFLYSELVPMYG